MKTHTKPKGIKGVRQHAVPRTCAVEKLMMIAREQCKVTPVLEPVWREIGLHDLAMLKALIKKTTTNPALNMEPKNQGPTAYPVAAATRIWQGFIVCLPSFSPYACKGSLSPNLCAVGIAEETADNSNGGAGAVVVKVRNNGWFRFTNYVADHVSLSDVGADCYIVDEGTVSRTSGDATRSVAGKVRDVDVKGVWVEFAPHKAT